MIFNNSILLRKIFIIKKYYNKLNKFITKKKCINICIVKKKT